MKIKDIGGQYLGSTAPGQSAPSFRRTPPTRPSQRPDGTYGTPADTPTSPTLHPPPCYHAQVTFHMVTCGRPYGYSHFETRGPPPESIKMRLLWTGGQGCLSRFETHLCQKRGYGLQKGGIVDILRKYRGSVRRKEGAGRGEPAGGY